LTGGGQEREVTNQNETTTKLNVIALEADGYKFCFFFLFYFIFTIILWQDVLLHLHIIFIDLLSFYFLRSKLQCTLFENYVDELNEFLGAGDCNNAVVIIQFAKAKIFQGFKTFKGNIYYPMLKVILYFMLPHPAEVIFFNCVDKSTSKTA
jgi:hypothetical protein